MGKVDFDEYVETYESLLGSQLSFFQKDVSYFSEYKIRLTADLIPNLTPRNILDFGCGIGLSIPYIRKHFPESSIFATDISSRSLRHVEKKFPYVFVLPGDGLKENMYDLIFVNVVFHHIPPEIRSQVINRLSSLLKDGGRLVVFEHNPYNPVTRHMVSICPYDEDAILIPLNGMKRLVAVQRNMEVDRYGYCLFFPKALVFLRFVEKYLRWLPLGGQYFFVARKCR